MVNSGQFIEGHEKVGGRQVGTLNKGTAELKALAREYGPEAVGKLAKLMRGKDTATAKLIAKLTETPVESAETADLIRLLLAKLNERKPDNELGAAKELLDRGYGKAAQPLTNEDGTGPAKILIERVIVDPKAPPITVVEGEVVEVHQAPNGQGSIKHIMRHPAVDKDQPNAQLSDADTGKGEDS